MSILLELPFMQSLKCISRQQQWQNSSDGRKESKCGEERSGERKMCEKQKTIKWSRHVMSLCWMDEFCSRFFIRVQHIITSLSFAIHLILSLARSFSLFCSSCSCHSRLRALRVCALIPYTLSSLPRFHNKQLTPKSKLMTAGVGRLIEFLLLQLYDKWFASCNQ